MTHAVAGTATSLRRHVMCADGNVGVGVGARIRMDTTHSVNSPPRLTVLFHPVAPRTPSSLPLA